MVRREAQSVLGELEDEQPKRKWSALTPPGLIPCFLEKHTDSSCRLTNKEKLAV